MRFKIAIITLFLALATLNSNAQSVGLVLSGGGAKGLSHVGVIKALEENNIPIDYICGTSMGAIVGGLYAIGMTPDEMIELFKSKEFESWYKGLPEQTYASYLYREDPNAGMFNFLLTRKVDEDAQQRLDYQPGKRKHKLQIDMPTSLVSPFPMDLAIIETFAPSSVASGEDFNNLMVPFFCVAADITYKTPYVLQNGNLGAAIRASMTYPLYFKPIVIDSTLLFDGGFYNNFPWDVMDGEYSPDFILGAKCVEGDMSLKEDDVLSHVENMVMGKTDYDIPQEKGMVIGRKYPYGIMDFHKVDEIVEMGYQNTLLYIDQIKERVKRERSPEELSEMRRKFRAKEKPLLFSSKIEVNGDLSGDEKTFITKTIVDGSTEKIDFETLKRGYYRVVATDFLKTCYPYYEVGEDSLLVLKLRAIKTAPWKVSVGGNISSSSLNQGYVGATYSHLSKKPWKVGAGINVGKLYKGIHTFWRQDIGIRPLAYYSAEYVLHQYDYYSGNQTLFATDKLPKNIQHMEHYGKFNVATPLSINKNLLLKFSFVAGQEIYKYYQTDNYTSDDKRDRTTVSFFSPMIGMERSTLDYWIYPTDGKRESLSLNCFYAAESYNPGSTSREEDKYKDIKRDGFAARIHAEAYFKLSKNFSLGYLVEGNYSTENKFGNYISTMLATPAFRPFPHSNTVIMERYRANKYIGVGLSPVVLFTSSIYLHTNISWFQPYRYIMKDGISGYRYSERMPRGAMMANVAIVWQSPIGPVSFATTYYEKGKYKWYPQFNIGFLIFKKGAFEL